MNSRPLSFLRRMPDPDSPHENILKADLLIHALYKKNIEFATQIINSPGDTLYLNFRLHNENAYDYQSGQLKTREYTNFLYPSDLPRTALTLASYYGLTEIVALLIKKNANVNLTSLYTPLEYAVHFRKNINNNPVSLTEYQAIAILLITNGAHVSDMLRDLDEDSILPINAKLQMITKKVLVTASDNTGPEEKKSFRSNQR